MFNFNGKNYYVPQAYGVIKIIQLGGGALPDFNVGVIIAESPLGCPYQATYNGASLEADEIFSAYDDIQALKKDYGDGDLLKKFIFAKKTAGGNSIFVLNARLSTPFSVGLTGASSAASMTLAPKKHFYGVAGARISYAVAESASTTVLISGTATAGGNTTITDSAATWGTTQYVDKWVEITGGTGIGQTRKIISHTGTALTVAAWTTNPDSTSTYRIVEPKFTFSITPPKDVKMVGSNITSGDKYIYLKGIEDLYPGKTINLSLGATSTSTTDLVTIKSIDPKWTSSGYKVYLEPTATLPSIAYSTANFSFAFSPDLSRKETYVFVGSEWTIANVVKVINDTSEIVLAAVAGTVTPSVASTTYLGWYAFGTDTFPTSPAVSSTNYAAIASLLPTMFREFEIAYKTKIRLIDLGTSSATDHAVFRDIAVTLRDNPILSPVQIIAGTAMGDTQTVGSADTNPTYRAYNLNSDEIQLVAGGVDNMPAYLSHSSLIFGIRISSPVLHNVTRDKLPISSVEKKWTYLELEKLIKGGVTTYNQNRNGRYVCFSINTYQDQSQQWNKEDKKTFLTAQRDKADFVYRGLLEHLDNNSIGTDSSREDITKALDTYINGKMLENGYVTGYSLSSKPVEGGVIEMVDIDLPDQIDYVGLILGIRTGRV